MFTRLRRRLRLAFWYRMMLDSHEAGSELGVRLARMKIHQLNKQP